MLFPKREVPLGTGLKVRDMDAPKVALRGQWRLTRRTLTLTTGLFVAATACLLPLLSSQQSQNETQTRMGNAFNLRNAAAYQHFLENEGTGQASRLELARGAFLEQDYQGALGHLRMSGEVRPSDAGFESGEARSAEDEDSGDFKKELEQCVVYSLAWPEKVVAWLSAELDGEKDPILARLVDAGVGATPHAIRAEFLGWRNQRYRVIEPEDFSLDGQSRRETSLPIRNLLSLSTTNCYRPKESSKGQIFLSYLSQHQDYVAEIFLLKDGRLRRYRWISQRPIIARNDHLEVFNSDLRRTESWVMRVERWHAEKNGSSSL